MIELGCIGLPTELATVEARNKILWLTQALQFDRVTATRLATAVSELGRHCTRVDREACLTVRLLPQALPPMLELEFRFRGDMPELARLRSFFKGVNVNPEGRGDGRNSCISLTQYLPRVELVNDQDFIHHEQERLRSRSREELLAELQEKNAALEAHQAGLEKTIADRTEALRVATKRAEEANEAKSAFLATMSHEIRTPMNAIINMTSLALETHLTRKQQQYLTVVESSAKGLLALINDILDFSKIEAGKLDLEAAPFSLRQLLEELTHSFRGRVLEKHVEFIVHVALDVPDQMLGDTLRLRQVLINLVGNAFKFTDQGEVLLRVNLEDRTSAGSAVDADEIIALRFTVRDSGIGIPKDKLGGLFNPFTQVDSSTSRKYGGTGLGLTICKKLIDLMGGNLTVESEEGKGSTFTFVVRFRRSRAEVQRQLTVPEGIQEVHALIIEDNPTSQELLRTLFESYGMACRMVDSGERGLELLEQGDNVSDRSQAFSLVVLDWLLPGIDGLTTAKRIRHRYKNRKLPIIMISAFAGKMEEAQATEVGIDFFLPKPITASSLYDAVLQVNGLAGDGDGHRLPVRVGDSEFQGVPLLLAEDNAVNQFVAEEILTAAGFELDIVSNGREAVQRFGQKSYAAILMDVQMPEMDGLEATRYIRSELRGRPLPIIAMTANAMKSEEEACRAAGMDDFVPKPVDRTFLFKTLRKWVAPRMAESTKREKAMMVEPLESNAELTKRSSPSAEFSTLNISGLDANGTMKRLGISQEVYVRMLRRFADGQQKAIDDLQTALESDDRDTARRHAHSIAGAAGNLGAEDLRQRGKELETALKEPVGDVSRLFEDLQTESARVIEGIQGLSREQSGTMASSSGDATRLAMDDVTISKILRTLKEHLGAGDLEALSMTISGLATGIPAGYKSQVEKLRDLIEAYDFDEAAEIVDRLLERFRVN